MSRLRDALPKWCKENVMNPFGRMNRRGHIKRIGALSAIAVALFALAAAAQTAKDVKGATPLVAIQNEAAPRLVVDPPVPEQLALGRVFIQYRTENLRILPVFGNAATSVRKRPISSSGLTPDCRRR